MSEAMRWSAASDDPEARELHQRAAGARNQLRSMCEGNPYLVIVELEDAVRTLARRPLEDERDRLRDALKKISMMGSEDWRDQRVAISSRAELCRVAEVALTSEPAITTRVY